MRYRYFQPNEKDSKDEYGDCQIRAIAKAFGINWKSAFDVVVRACLEIQCVPSDSKTLEYLLKDTLGYNLYGIRIQKGKKRMTVSKFANKFRHGTYIIGVANHCVTVINGYYYDTWDCGDCCIYTVYTKNGGELDGCKDFAKRK